MNLSDIVIDQTSEAAAAVSYYKKIVLILSVFKKSLLE